jgi:TPR repeat protein
MDAVEAARYFEMAANQEHLKASYELGKFLLAGRGVAQNQKKAIQLFSFAAFRGLSDAQVAYASYLLDCGKVVEGARWAEQAAGRKNSAGEFLYGKCLRDGIGVPRNLESAAVYFKRAAVRGNGDAQQAYVALSNPGVVLHVDDFSYKETIAEDTQNPRLGRGHMRMILILVYWMG